MSKIGFIIGLVKLYRQMSINYRQTSIKHRQTAKYLYYTIFNKIAMQKNQIINSIKPDH